MKILRFMDIYRPNICQVNQMEYMDYMQIKVSENQIKKQIIYPEKKEHCLKGWYKRAESTPTRHFPHTHHFVTVVWPEAVTFMNSDVSIIIIGHVNNIPTMQLRYEILWHTHPDVF